MPSDLGGTLWGEGQSRLSWKGCLLGSEKKRKAALACLEHTSQNPISKQEKYSSHKTPKSAWILQHVAWTAFRTQHIYTFYSLLFATYRYFSLFTSSQFAPQKIIRIFLELAHQSCPQYIIRTDESSESYFWHLPLRRHIIMTLPFLAMALCPFWFGPSFWKALLLAWSTFDSPWTFFHCLLPL